MEKYGGKGEINISHTDYGGTEDSELKVVHNPAILFERVWPSQMFPRLGSLWFSHPRPHLFSRRGKKDRRVCLKKRLFSKFLVGR